MAYHRPFSVTMSKLAVTVMLLYVLSIHSISAQVNTSPTPLETTDSGTEVTDVTGTANASDTSLATTVASTESITTTYKANASDTTLATTVASTENITATYEETSSSNITTSSINDTTMDDFNTTKENSTTLAPTTVTTTTPATTTLTQLPTTTAPAKGFGQNCIQPPECLADLVCNGSTCGCKADEYYNSTGGADLCNARKPNGDPCTNNTECNATLTCLNTTKKCGCLDTEYFDPNNATDSCPDRKPNGDPCTNNAECKATLTCLNTTKKCGCLDTEYFDQKNATDLCPDKLNYTAICDGITAPDVCKEPTTTCVSYLPSSPKKRCLCAPGLYRTDDKACIAKSNLNITGGVPTIKTDYIVFSWTTSPRKSSVNYTISYNGINVTANTTGGNVTGLTPGTRYSFKVTSTLPADDNYQNFTEETTNQLWTYPAKPGLVQSVKLISSPISPPYEYEIMFGKSLGNVSRYKIEVTGNGTKESLTAVVTYKLDPASGYNITLKSVNGNNDESESTTDSFNTSALASGPVEKLDTASVLEFSAIIKWQKPSFTNGKINGYFVQVKQEAGSCFYNISLDCGNCTQPFYVTGTFCNKLELETANSSYDVSSKYYFLELPSLKPYRNYTVLVLAVNEKGNGQESNVSFTTEIAVPYSVSNIQLSSNRNQSTRKVSLDISWTHGEQTGPTDYSVLVQNETRPGTDDYPAGTTYTVTGYSNTTYFVKEVLAYWQYKVSVMAITSKGSSNSTPTKITTDQTNPGLVQYLNVKQDTVIAKNITLTFPCPGQQEWNGAIKGFVINQMDNVTGAVSNYSYNVVSCGSEINYNGLTNITVGHGYSFTVKAVNVLYDGDFRPSTFLSVEAKVPQLKTVMEQLGADKFVKAPVPSTAQETSIALVVCAQCLADNSQGEIIHAGLVICVKEVSCPTTGRIRRALPASNYSNYLSWSAAAKNNFKNPYRTTPDDWRNTFTLQKDNLYAPYTVGSNTSCDKNAEAVFCNGPLPEGNIILITVVVCTSAGCEVLENKDDEYVLKKQSEGTNVGAIVGGILGGLAFIVIVCLIVVFLYRRNQPKKSQPSRTSAWELDAQDKEIKLKRPVKIRNFGEHVARFHRDSNLMFQDEFENIQTVCKTFTYTTEQAKIEQNRMKNRYVDIIPYDHSRVKLNIVPEDDETKDFINANYIPGYNSVREYIATQGPMYSTVPDFWRMAWEQKCKVIIMLSDLMEKGKRKVDLYWPENLNEPINYDHVVVEMTNFSQVSEYIVRTFKVTKGDEARKMTHLFVPGWPDWTADVGIDYVLNFVKLCRQETPVNPGPIIVHCSAGVGRTGTFIAVDNFTQFVDKRSLNEEIDIFDFVIQMRKNRARMVQVESQYIFIYDAINKVIQQKIKAEEERLYENTSSNGVYANMEQEENIYQNTNGKEDKYVYNNEAFVAEGDYSNVEPLKKSEKPITEL